MTSTLIAAEQFARAWSESARPILTTVPTLGSAHARVMALLERTRSKILEHHVSLVAGMALDETKEFVSHARTLLDASAPIRSLVLRSAEFGGWQALMRRCLEGTTADPTAEPRLADLLAEAAAFALFPRIHDAGEGTRSLRIPTRGLRAVPIVGARSFLILPEPRADHVEIEVTPQDIHVKAGSSRLTTSRHQAPDIFNGKSGSLDALDTLAAGFYREYTLNALDIDVARPLSRCHELGLAEMRQTVSSTTVNAGHVAFSHQAAPFAEDLNRAVGLLARLWPDALTLLPLEIQAVVPLRSDRVLSYSGSAARGVVFLGDCPRNPLWYSELLVHEFSHTWLNTLMAIVPILGNNPKAEYRSPWRADPRPLLGILLGAHAFAVVLELLCRAIGAGVLDDEVIADRIAYEWVRIKEGLAVARLHGEWTSAGAVLFEHMESYVAGVGRRVAALGLSDRRPGHLPLQFWPTRIERSQRQPS